MGTPTQPLSACIVMLSHVESQCCAVIWLVWLPPFFQSAHRGYDKNVKSGCRGVLEDLAGHAAWLQPVSCLSGLGPCTISSPSVTR